MGIIVGLGSAAYKREDGIFVVPIGCLRDWNIQLSQEGCLYTSLRCSVLNAVYRFVIFKLYVCIIS